jgi:hypothetical protein
MSLVTVAENKVLSEGDQREVRHIDFDWSGEAYGLGDVAMVQAQMPARDRCKGFLNLIAVYYLMRLAVPPCSPCLASTPPPSWRSKD